MSLAAAVSAGNLARPSRDATHRPAAPSVSGDELPAVSVPLAAGPIERWREPRQLLQRRVLARERVATQSADGNDEVVEESALPRRHGTLVTFERDPVLLLPRDAPFLRRDLGVLAHALAGRAIGDGRDVELDITELQIRESRETFCPSDRAC